MKKFYDGGAYFVLTAYRITAAPVLEDSEAGPALAKTICEDACYLSSAGSGQTAIELLRIAGRTAGSPMQHVLTIRTHDSAEQACIVRQEALEQGICSLLRQSGFTAEELSFADYKQYASAMEVGAVWALRKQDVQEYGVQETYSSPSVVEGVDWKRIYSALDGSGCRLCIQVIPSLLSDGEQQRIAKNAARCAQAVDGAVPNLRDSLAAAAAERWKYYAGERMRPFAEVNITVAGTVADAALVTARLRQAVHAASLCTVAVSDYRSYSIYNQPWKIACALQKAGPASFRKWTAEEASQILQLPMQGDYFIGVDRNAFSRMPEIDLLPEQLRGNQEQSLSLGTSIASSQRVSLPIAQLLLHTAVMGKSGSGKTTLLKQLIVQARRREIPVLILEPVKREYRDLAANMNNSRIFTVERPVVPLLINPFCPPKGVPLGEYRSSLLSAFKAAFSLPDPLPSVFEKAISEAYTQNGWTDRSTGEDRNVTVFDMADFVRIFRRMIARSDYSSEVKGNMMSGGALRLQSLIERCPRTFDTLHATSVEDLLSGCTVLEMGSLEPEQKSLVSALTLIRILAYLKATRQSGHQLRNVILIDEAHALLDQGDGATQEEKALNSTMTQLMMNIITEIRAYGVGVIFSDQSPSRVGGQMLDNVDNVISFRLSGEEAELLRAHIGAEDRLCEVLPLMSAGEFVLKNRFLRSALPVRMDAPPEGEQQNHVSDDHILKTHAMYLAAHAKDYCPYVLCAQAGCSHCTAAVREAANMLAAGIFAQHKLHTPENLAAHIVGIPAVLASQGNDAHGALFQKKCGCVAVHLLRKCALENGISFGAKTAARLLTEMQQGRGGNEHE